MTQTVSLRPAAGRIGAVSVRFRLSGWLGGWAAGPATSGSRWPSAAVPGGSSAGWSGCAR